MIKTKRQLRAEAVERLQNHDDDSIIQEVESTIELLSDGTDSREKLEADALDCLRIWISNHDPQLRGHGLAALETIADMIERDYVRRAVYDSLKELTTNSDKWLKNKLEEARAERDECKAKAESILNAKSYKFESESDAERYTDCGKVEDDSREKLEADARALQKRIWQAGHDHDAISLSHIIELLDRQAAITANELTSQFDVPKSGKTTENSTAKNEIRDFDDTREKLEADVLKYYTHTTSTLMWPVDANIMKKWVSVSMDTVLEWLDRQDAITRRECDKPNWDYCETCELTAERDIYREKLSRALDLAHEIERLMP